MSALCQKRTSDCNVELLNFDALLHKCIPQRLVESASVARVAHGGEYAPITLSEDDGCRLADATRRPSD
jgi:hypothetical protein